MRATLLQQGIFQQYIAHKFESGWEVGLIKAFDRRALIIKYEDDPACPPSHQDALSFP